MTNIGDGRPVRECGLCDVVDDHPRHLTASAQGASPLSADHHHDCGRLAGCTYCAAKTRGAEDLTGADLLAHLLKGVR